MASMTSVAVFLTGRQSTQSSLHLAIWSEIAPCVPAHTDCAIECPAHS